MVKSKEALHRLLAQSECVYDAPAIHAALDRLALQLEEVLSDTHPLVLPVLHGGLIFTGHLLPRLNFPLQQDYVHASRYRGGKQGRELQWFSKPQCSLQGRVVLLLDDIFDEGFTLEALHNFCLQQGAAQVISAVLIKKNHPREVAATQPDFFALEVDDRYCFGFGMDHKHEWRNANGIFVAKEDRDSPP